MIRMKRCLSLLLALAILLAHTASLPLQTAAAQAESGLSLTVAAGFAGYYKEGKWFPVRVVLENQGAELEGTLQVRFSDIGTNAQVFASPVSLPSISRKEFTIYVFPQGYGRELEVSLTTEKKTLVLNRIQVNQVLQDYILYGILSDTSSAFNLLGQVSPPNRTAFIAQLTLQDLPDRVQALDSLDILVISNSDTGVLTPSQREAIWTWVASGGRLIVTGGANWQKTLAGLNDSDRLPVQFSKTQRISDMNEISLLSQSVYPLESVPEGILIATGKAAPDAQILASGSDSQGQTYPVVSRRLYGGGEILLLSFDPAMPPFKNWDGREDFYRRLFSYPLFQPSWLKGLRNWSQAKEAAQTLLKLGLPSPLLICGFLLFYVLLIGPLNYFFLRKIKRRELGWITTPLLVAGVSILVILVGVAFRGSQPILNRAAIIQAWEGLPQARIDGVIGIFSPLRTTYQAVADAPFMFHPLPEPSGMAARSPTIQQSAGMWRIPSLQIDISGILPFAFEGALPAPRLSHDLTLTPDDQGTVLEGEVTLESPLTLQDAVLLAPGAALQLGEISAGQPARVRLSLRRAQYGGSAMNSLPFKLTLGAGMSIPLPVSSQGDRTIEDLIGVANYYDDRETYRRYALISAALNTYYDSGGTRGGGFYLAGWSKAFPAELPPGFIRLANQSFSTEDTVAYLIALRPALHLNDEKVTLTPGLFTWQVIEGNDYAISPYDYWIYPGAIYALEFTPLIRADFNHVEGLTLHLEQSSGSGAVSGMNLSLWDFSAEDWVLLQDLRWGDNPVPEAQSLVSPDGAIRLRVETDLNTSLQLTRTDFTLVAGKIGEDK